MIDRLLWIALLVVLPLGLLESDHAYAQQRTYVADAQGRRVGYTMIRQNRVEAYDASGRRLGYYDSRTDKTYDASGRIIARGDVVSALIWNDR